LFLFLDDYTKGKEFEKKATVTSSLESSEPEIECHRLRKRRAKFVQLKNKRTKITERQSSESEDESISLNSADEEDHVFNHQG